MGFVTSSLRGKLTALFLLVAVAPLSIATALAVRSSRATVERQVGSATVEMARQLATWIDRVIYERTLELEGAAASGELAAATIGMGDSATVEASLTALAKRSQLVRSASLYDAGGEPVGVSTGATSMAAGNEAWFAAASKSAAPTFIGPVVRNADGSLGVKLAAGVRSGSGSVLGVLMMELDWAAIGTRALGELEAAFARSGDKSVRAYVVGADGAVIGSSIPADALSLRIDDPALVEQFAGHASVAQIAPALGREALVAVAPIINAQAGAAGYTGFGGGNTSVVITDDTEHAFAEATGLRNMLILISIAITAVVGLAAWVLAGRIANPLAEAAGLAERLAVGDTTREIAPLDQVDEAGRLNGALRNLHAYMRELTAASEHVAAGQMNITLQPKGENDELSRAFLTVARTNDELVAELGRITTCAAAGDLRARADSDRFAGAYREVVDGVNRTLDAVIAPINEAAEVLERLAASDLTARVEGTYHGDHAKIAHALNAAAENLDDALTTVSSMAEHVAAAAGQIGSGSQGLASSASEQAGSLQEVSASLQDLAARTRQNVTHVQEAAGIADEARAATEGGSAGMTRLLDAMERIKQSSDSTARIVKTIDEIAFQTNLLALNAAVEAARAGDAGKGFAVVAEEVRALALRSADAAKQTAGLIEQAVKNVEDGVTINADVQRSLTDINRHVLRVREVTESIATSSTEQRHGVDQITAAVEQMNGVTQQVAANAQESSATAQELSSQADGLRSTLDGFTLTQLTHADRSYQAAPAAASTPKLAARPAARPAARRPAGRVVAKAPAGASATEAAAPKSKKGGNARRGGSAPGSGKGAAARKPAEGVAASAAAFFPIDDDEAVALNEF